MGPARVVPLRRYAPPNDLVKATQLRLTALERTARQALEEHGHQGFAYFLMEHATALNSLVSEAVEALNNDGPPGRDSARTRQELQELFRQTQELVKATRTLMRALGEKLK